MEGVAQGFRPGSGRLFVVVVTKVHKVFEWPMESLWVFSTMLVVKGGEGRLFWLFFSEMHKVDEWAQVIFLLLPMMAVVEVGLGRAFVDVGGVADPSPMKAPRVSHLRRRFTSPLMTLYLTVR